MWESTDVLPQNGLNIESSKKARWANRRHVVLVDRSFRGQEYGMLRDFESAIQHRLGAPFLELPVNLRLAISRRFFSNGTRYSPFRGFIPSTPFPIEADVVWVVLMSPENSNFDLIQGWDSEKKKVLYLFDTFESQIDSIKRLAKSTKWDLLITSFAGAIPFLENATQQKWHCVPQGVDLRKFCPRPFEERQIGFSSYGRRHPRFHEILKSFCLERDIYYDYTTRSELDVAVTPQESYRQYAWHLTHSIFTVAWPVEVTHPHRAVTFSPITCRWFEAAAAASVIIGELPRDPTLKDVLGFDECVSIDLKQEDSLLKARLNSVWENRIKYSRQAEANYQKFQSRWSWENRVDSILELLE